MNECHGCDVSNKAAVPTTDDDIMIEN